MSGQRLTDLKVVRVTRTNRRGNVYDAVFFSSESIPVELYCASRYAVVVEEGLPDRMWGGAEPSTEAASTDAIPERTVGDPINISVFAPTGNRAEDIAAV